MCLDGLLWLHERSVANDAKVAGSNSREHSWIVEGYCKSLLGDKGQISDCK